MEYYGMESNVLPKTVRFVGPPDIIANIDTADVFPLKNVSE